MVIEISVNRPALSFFPYSASVKLVTVGKPDKYGKPTISDPVEYACDIRMNTKNETFLDFMGNETVFVAKILFPFPVKIKVNDRIIFTDDLGKEQEKSVIAVQVKRDFGRNIIAVKAVI